MTVCLYFDEDLMWQALITALRARGIDVQTALEATMIERADEAHLAYATAQGRVLCSFNVGDFYRLYTRYMAQHQVHAGIVLARQQQYGVGEYMRRLLRLMTHLTAEEMHKLKASATKCGVKPARDTVLGFLLQERIEHACFIPRVPPGAPWPPAGRQCQSPR